MADGATGGVSRDEAMVLLADIVRDVLADETLSIAEATRLPELPRWDSLAHIAILAAVEIRFGVEVRCAEAGDIMDIGALLSLILSKRPRLGIFHVAAC